MYYTGSNAFANLRQGLVAAYCPSISGQGNVLPDLVGGNHGTLTNMDASDWVASGDGRALQFDGDDTSGGNDSQNRVTLNKDFGVDVIGFSAWVNAITLNKRGICASWPNNTNPRFALTLLTNGTLEVYRGQNTQSTAALSTNRWQHIFVFSDGNNTSYYIDGVFSNTANQQGISPGLQTNFLLGNNYWGALEGYLDDVRIYDRNLSLAEIKLLASKRGIGLRQESHRNKFYQFPSGARRRRILTGMP
jgi:hypothetical protein